MLSHFQCVYLTLPILANNLERNFTSRMHCRGGTCFARRWGQEFGHRQTGWFRTREPRTSLLVYIFNYKRVIYICINVERHHIVTPTHRIHHEQVKFFTFGDLVTTLWSWKKLTRTSKYLSRIFWNVCVRAITIMICNRQMRTIIIPHL